MATQTTNYGLTKPSYNETADIGVINSNMDIIDAKMKEIDNKAGSGGGGGNTDTYGHVKVGSVTIDASGDDTIELVAGSNVTLTPDTTSKSVTISATGGGGGTSDYLQLSNKPKINGVELVDNITTENLGIVVPQYTSELVNDSGFITNETDPTVPAWAKEPTKPTYTAEEVGALPNNTPIPDPTSVVVDRFVSAGTHIADISVNGKKTELYAPTGGGGTSVTVDSELSTTSENPVQNKVITQALNEKGTYSKPTGGIPKTDLASEVQTSLGKADTALQEHQDISGKANKADVTALSNTISDAWNASTTYAVGQYCIYNNLLWKCLVQHSGQTPTEGTYWTKVSVANEITSVNNSIGDISNVGNTTYNSVEKILQYYIDNGYLPDLKGMALIPVMTSNTKPSGVASAISERNTAPAYYAFRNLYDNTSSSEGWGANDSKGTNHSNLWLMYKFPKAVTVKKFRIYFVYTANVNYKIQGSNNGSEFTDLGTFTTVRGTELLQNTNSYLYYRLFITSQTCSTANVTGGNVRDLQLYGY